MLRKIPNIPLLAIGAFADVFKTAMLLALTSLSFAAAAGAPVVGTAGGAGAGCIIGGVFGGLIGFLGLGVGAVAGAAAGCAIGGGTGAVAGGVAGTSISVIAGPMGFILGYIVTVCINFCIGLGGIVMFLILTGAVRLKTFLLFIMPVFILSIIPFVGSLAPSWTAVVWKVTSQAKQSGEDSESEEDTEEEEPPLYTALEEESSEPPPSMNDDIRTPRTMRQENYA